MEESSGPDEYKNYYTHIMSQSKYSTGEHRGLEALKKAKKVVLDCDPGGDDAQALVLAFHMAKTEGVEILGVTTVAGNAVLEQVVLNAQLVMSVCGVGPEVPLLRGEEPFGKGKELSEYFYGPDGFGNALLDYQKEHGSVPTPNVRDEPAFDFLARIAREHPGEITIVGLAPLTNLALAQKKDPTFAKSVRDVVLLGGTYLA